MIQVGDWIRHRKRKRLWRVVEVRPDGWLEVVRRTAKGTLERKVITRPEEYVVSMSHNSR